jgi:hypothetical protein
MDEGGIEGSVTSEAEGDAEWGEERDLEGRRAREGESRSGRARCSLPSELVRRGRGDTFHSWVLSEARWENFDFCKGNVRGHLV